MLQGTSNRAAETATAHKLPEEYQVSKSMPQTSNTYTAATPPRGLLYWRTRAKLTQLQLAARADVGLNTVQRIEQDKGSVLHSTLLKVSGALADRLRELGHKRAPLPGDLVGPGEDAA